MINDNIYKSIHSMASATGPTATGISHDANPADDVNNTDPNLKRISQFILLGAAEATGIDIIIYTMVKVNFHMNHRWILCLCKIMKN